MLLRSSCGSASTSSAKAGRGKTVCCGGVIWHGVLSQHCACAQWCGMSVGALAARVCIPTPPHAYPLTHQGLVRAWACGVRAPSWRWCARPCRPGHAAAWQRTSTRGMRIHVCARTNSQKTCFVCRFMRAHTWPPHFKKQTHQAACNAAWQSARCLTDGLRLRCLWSSDRRLKYWPCSMALSMGPSSS